MTIQVVRVVILMCLQSVIGCSDIEGQRSHVSSSDDGLTPVDRRTPIADAAADAIGCR